MTPLKTSFVAEKHSCGSRRNWHTTVPHTAINRESGQLAFTFKALPRHLLRLAVPARGFGYYFESRVAALTFLILRNQSTNFGYNPISKTSARPSGASYI